MISEYMKNLKLPVWQKEYAFTTPSDTPFAAPEGNLAMRDNTEIDENSLNVFQRILRTCFGFYKNMKLSNSDKEVDKISLNIFQRILRTYFGFYKNTRLNEVGRAAVRAMIVADSQDPEIVALAHKYLKGREVDEISLGMEWKDGVRFSVKYQVGFGSQEDPLRDLRFKLTVFTIPAIGTAGITHSGSVTLHVRPHTEEEVAGIYLEKIAIENKSENKSQSGKELNPLIARVAHAFLIKLVSSSKTVSQLFFSSNFSMQEQIDTGELSLQRLVERLREADRQQKITKDTLKEDPPGFELETPFSLDFMKGT